jgi:hypothetical protein
MLKELITIVENLFVVDLIVVKLHLRIEVLENGEIMHVI